MKDKLQNIQKRLDRFQRRHTATAFPVAVIKRYGEDKAGRRAALVTYYAFLSIFPLLLVFLTVLSVFASHDPMLEAQITNHVFQLIPTGGGDIQHSIHGLHGFSLAIIFELFTLFYGARGLASVLQETFNNVWHVADKHRPNFLNDNLRSVGMMLSIGLGIGLGTALSYTVGNIIHIGVLGTVLVNILNIVVTTGLFLVVFRLGTVANVPLKNLLVGALIATVGTILVQRFGGYLMANQVAKLSNLYGGQFALVLGLLFWIYLQVQIVLYAIEITIVQTQRDWPKRLFG